MSLSQATTFYGLLQKIVYISYFLLPHIIIQCFYRTYGISYCFSILWVWFGLISRNLTLTFGPLELIESIAMSS